jgi:peptide/nickel transport system ATP-binding protein/oligopeptide transport system ATP-binding protein
VAELASDTSLYRHPRHPYTGALLSAIPIPSPEQGRARRPIVLPGDVPDPANPPSGCRFHPRCPRARGGVCDTDEPRLRELAAGHLSACHFPLERWPMSADEVREPAAAGIAGA